MHISEERSAGLKTWIIKKLEHISDADSDVLADYVLALLRTEAPEGKLRRTVIENLEDFLKSNTVSFVDELLQIVIPKAKPPTLDAPAPQVIPSIASGPSDTAYAGSPGRDGRSAGSILRKRTYSGMHAAPGSISPTSRGERQMKHLRRGRSASRGSGNRTMGPPPTFPMNGGISPSVPFDPQQAATALLTLQSMGMPVPPLFEGMLPPPPSSMGRPQRGGKGKGHQRCRDYDTKGICHRGANCPYLHDENQIIVPSPFEEYDPKTPNVAVSQAVEPPESANGHTNGASSRGGRGNTLQTSPRSRRERFGAPGGGTYDPSATALVITHIPEPQFTEDAIRAHFSQFGPIQSIILQPDRWLARLTYATHASAQAAYESPKAIFENRFVKVFWHRQRSGAAHPSSPSSSARTELEFDLETFAASTAAAQQRFEQRRVLKKENDAKIADIAHQQATLDEERKRLEEELRKRGWTDDETPKSTTEVLRAQLKALEQEAKSLGLEPEPYSSRGRGGFRGRASFRGRGAFRGLPGGGAYNLDNRPKAVRVEIEGENEIFDAAKDEALRQFLFSVAEFTAIASSDDGSAQVITFKDRPGAERFFYGTRDIPGVGKVGVQWVREEKGEAVPTVRGDASGGEYEDGEEHGDGREEETEKGDDRDEREEREMDWDVAEDEEQWIR